ncbi:MAG: (d)CMP kinase [Saprospiraceae bacterium]|nr:(d)CMP kinase [Saprospiraceae bacterium]
MRMPMKAVPLTIAIDGYSSSGKSTLAKQLAKKLGYIFVDTGAMYRAVALYFFQNKVNLLNHVEVMDALAHIHISFKYLDAKNTTFLNGENVEELIRSVKVSGLVSQVAAISAVRKKMVSLQQAMDDGSGLVMDGRDIGTVVFPRADVKLFITADVKARAQRRFQELTSKGHEVSLSEIEENLRQRDKMDTERADSPLKMAVDAIAIDNTHLNIEQQFAKAWEIIQAVLKTRNS